jgi:hypothetical protein
LGLWVIEYWDTGTSTFIPFQATWDQTNEELDGDCYATFYLANSAENRALIQQDLLVAVWFDDTLVFSGTLSGGDLGSKRIKAVIYDTVMLTLDEAEPISGVYDQKAASTIAADIVAGTGITLGSCPSTPVSAVFYNANRLDCFKFLADALNLDLYSTSGTHINLAVKGSGVVWTPSSISVSNRGLDRSKQRTKVIIRGLDCWGHHILGVAGSGTKVKTFSNNSVTDETTLNGMASKKLAELNTDSSGAPVSVLITIGKAYAPGDSVAVVNDQYLLNGTYRIKQLNKTRTQVKLQLDKFRKSLDRTIEDLRSWEDQGIYLPGSTSWSLNLQGLVGLFHLNEGEGVAAKNKAPVDSPIDGVITAGSWEDGPITKMLTFNGSSSMVSLGDPSKTGINLTGKLSFGGWFSPSVITASITIGSTVHYFNSDAGIATVGARLFVMVTYDLAHVHMYVNGYLHKTWSQTGNPDSSANTVYLGVFLKGVLAEVMLWSRALVDQEVLELYFFPLFRVVGGGGAGADYSTSKWYCAVSTDARYGEVSPNGLQAVNVGLDLVMSANRYDQHTFSKWVIDVGLDGETESTDNPYIFPAQAGGSTHTAWAIFVPSLPVTNGVPLPIDLLIDIELLTSDFIGYSGPFEHYQLIRAISTLTDVEILGSTFIGYQGHAYWYSKIAGIATAASVTPTAGSKWCVHKHDMEFGYFSDMATQYLDADEVVACNLGKQPSTTSSAINIQAVHPSSGANDSSAGQSFTGNGQVLKQAFFLLAKYGSPVGNLKAVLYTHTGTFGTDGKPTGAAIETSSAVAMASLPTYSTNYAWTLFTFAGTTILTAGTNYCIVVYADSATTLSTSHYVKVAYGDTAPVILGNGCYFDSSSWKNVANDMLFVVTSTNDGATLAVTALAYHVLGFVFSANPILFDGVAYGTVDAIGSSASWIVPKQFGGTVHALSVSTLLGWGVYPIGGCTPAGYAGVQSGAAKGYTRSSTPGSGYHSQWYLDGSPVGGNTSTYTIAAQTNGTIHTIEHQIQPN